MQVLWKPGPFSKCELFVEFRSSQMVPFSMEGDVGIKHWVGLLSRLAVVASFWLWHSGSDRYGSIPFEVQNSGLSTWRPRQWPFSFLYRDCQSGGARGPQQLEVGTKDPSGGTLGSGMLFPSDFE